MFGRKAASGRDVLAERMRQIVEPRPAPATAEGAAAATVASASAHSVAKSVRKRDRPERHPMFRTATIVTHGGGRQNVAMKDVSATGARIEFHTRGMLPDYVVIIEPMMKLNRRARVVWQDEGIAGLEFMPE